MIPNPAGPKTRARYANVDQLNRATEMGPQGPMQVRMTDAGRTVASLFLDQVQTRGSRARAAVGTSDGFRNPWRDLDGQVHYPSLRSHLYPSNRLASRQIFSGDVIYNLQYLLHRPRGLLVSRYLLDVHHFRLDNRARLNGFYWGYD